MYIFWLFRNKCIFLYKMFWNKIFNLSKIWRNVGENLRNIQKLLNKFVIKSHKNFWSGIFWNFHEILRKFQELSWKLPKNYTKIRYCADYSVHCSIQPVPLCKIMLRNAGKNKIFKKINLNPSLKKILLVRFKTRDWKSSISLNPFFQEAIEFLRKNCSIFLARRGRTTKTLTRIVEKIFAPQRQNSRSATAVAQWILKKFFLTEKNFEKL